MSLSWSYDEEPGRPRVTEGLRVVDASGRGNKLGLRGWVRNQPDESVEGVAVGSTDQITSLYVLT